MNIIIKIKNASQRLDKFLAERLKDLSRSQIQKLIKQPVITVNGLPASSHYSLKTGDIINIKKGLAQPEKTKASSTLENLPDIKIIRETEEFLVINKPAGLAAHGPANYTLADWLKEHYPAIKQVGDDPERPGLVHRLDKDVSGLMVIAKTQAAFNNLKKQFQDRTVIKEYTALVHGKIQKDSAMINFPIKRAREGYKMAALPFIIKGRVSAQGREAETDFQVIKKYINYTLLKIKIKTGRTHQIRVHLAAYGRPIVGDNTYATAKTRIQNKKLDLNRIFLIAGRLAFTDLQNNRQDFKIDLTQELKNLLKIVK